MSSIFTLLNDKKVNKDLDNAKGMIMSMKQYYRFNYNINDYIDYYENNEWKVGKIINMNNATLSVVDIEKGSTYTLSHNQQNQLFFPFRSHTVRYTDSKNIIENDISNESLYEMNSFLSIIFLSTQKRKGLLSFFVLHIYTGKMNVDICNLKACHILCG